MLIICVHLSSIIKKIELCVSRSDHF